MSAARPVLTVGLTGGIASGKSTVDAMFEDLGADIIDADRIVHSLLGRGGAAAELVIEAFGPEVALADGSVDRAALGRIVFADAAARAHLEQIIHPRVSKEIYLAILEHVHEPEGWPILIADIPLLTETGGDSLFDRIVVVTCAEETQVSRLLRLRGMTREAALLRIRSQASAAQKAARADYVIENDGTLAQTRARVEEVYGALLEEYERLRASGRLDELPGRRRTL